MHFVRICVDWPLAPCKYIPVDISQVMGKRGREKKMSKIEMAYLAAVQEFEAALASQDLRRIQKAERALSTATKKAFG